MARGNSKDFDWFYVEPGGEEAGLSIALIFLQVSDDGSQLLRM